MKFHKTLLLILLCGLSKFCHSQDTEAFQSVTLGNGLLHFGNTLINSDGTVLVCGWSNYDDGSRMSLAPYGANDIWLAKLNKDYTLQWKKSYGGSADEVNPILCRDGQGKLYLACTSGSANDVNRAGQGFASMDVLFMQLNEKGEVLHEWFYGSFNTDNLKTVLALDQNNVVICGTSNEHIVGSTTPINGGDDFWVFCVDSTGKVVWEDIKGSSGEDYLCDADVDAYGNIYITGISNIKKSQDSLHDQITSDLVLYKLSPKGELIWEKNTGDINNSRTFELHCGETSCYLAFTSIHVESAAQSSPDFRIMKFDSAGNLLWDKYIGEAGKESFRTFELTSSKNLIVGGYSNSNRGGFKTENARSQYDFWVVALDSNGVKKWDKTVFSSDEQYLKTINEVKSDSYLCVGPSVKGLSVVRINYKRI